MIEEGGTVEAFATDLQQEVLQLAALEDSEVFIPEAFLTCATDLMADAGEIDDAQPCYLRLHGLEIGAWSIDPDEGRLDLFVAIHTGGVPPPTVTRDRIETAFRRMTTFYQKARDGLHTQIEEASPAFDMTLQIFELSDVICSVRMFVLTDGRTTVDHVPATHIDAATVTYHVWDIVRLERLATSGAAPEPIVVDLESDYGLTLSALPISNEDAEYDAFLLLIPGTLLASIYERFGARLLESNVRTFLQARGKVNKGIRDTIRVAPDRFFAYNNGLTMTATGVVRETSDGIVRLSRLEGLQIVNGGQTTASIYTAAYRDKLSVDNIDVPAKLIVARTAVAEELVPSISRFSNTQNRVSQSDFSTNNPFHVQLEKLSRSVWAPAVDGGQRQTRWFYERARGQYQDAKNREPTRARKRQFTATHPASQKFTKTDLAKFEHAWAQLPHLVSRGAQKNYALFFDEVGKRGDIVPDEDYFHQLVAKAILFRRTEKIVSAQKFGGYRANIVAYTLALLSHLTAQRVDLEKIWREQRLSPALEQAIEDLCRLVQPLLVDPPEGRNITEWTKMEKCWDTVLREVHYSLSPELESELLSVGAGHPPRRKTGVETVTTADQEKIVKVISAGADWWLMLSTWARQTNNLQPWQRGIAYSIGRRIQQGREPSRRQAVQGVRIMEEAERLGFHGDDTNA